MGAEGGPASSIAAVLWAWPAVGIVAKVGCSWTNIQAWFLQAGHPQPLYW